MGERAPTAGAINSELLETALAHQVTRRINKSHYKSRRVWVCETEGYCGIDQGLTQAKKTGTNNIDSAPTSRREQTRGLVPLLPRSFSASLFVSFDLLKEILCRWHCRLLNGALPPQMQSS